MSRPALPVLPLLLLAACAGADPDDSGPGDTGPDDTGTPTSPVTPAIAWFEDLLPVDLSPDGRDALAQRPSSMEGELVHIDTETGATEALTTLGDAARNLATGLSGGGHVSALYDVPVRAGRWSAAEGWRDLGTTAGEGCGEDLAGAFDVSDDGGVVVGLTWEGCSPAAFRWTEAAGMVALSRLGDSGGSALPTNRATVVSGDGRVAAGFAAHAGVDRSPARWTEDGAGELLAPDDANPGEVLAIDGTGATLGVLRGSDGWLWTAGGDWIDLGRPDGAGRNDPVYPLALTAAGDLAFGGVGSEFETVPTAFVWSAASGTRAAQALAEAAGVPVEAGALLTSVTAVSDDGTVLLGRGLDPAGNLRAFVLHAPAESWR